MIKEKLTQEPILALPHFDFLFKVEINYSRVVLEQFSSKRGRSLSVLVKNLMRQRRGGQPKNNNFMVL